MSTIVNEVIYDEKYGRTFTISNKVLGKGSYGKVYQGEDDKNNKIAIKICQIDDSGINNLYECSLMMSLKHPNINDAIAIVASKKWLYLIQPLAMMDLYYYTNMYKLNHRCDLKEILFITHSLLQAVAVLHSQNIIHGDIKSSNVLIYSDMTIKLTDFTLSTKKTDDCQFVHTVQTATHRSPEVHLKTGFDLSCDIWALGATFYEIVYQELLFKNQIPENTKLDNDPKLLKLFIKKKNINAIVDWALLTNQSISLEKSNVDYITTQLSPRWEESIYKKINKMIVKMLQIDQTARPTVFDLLKSKLYDGYANIDAEVITPITNKLSIQEHARVVRYIEQLADDEEVQSLAIALYSKIALDYIPEHEKVFGVVWVAMKLLLGNASTLMDLIEDLPHVLSIERAICHDLGFRLFI